jgi:hypothetical protein
MNNLSTNQRAMSQGVSALAASCVTETETISKNAACPKIQTSKIYKYFPCDDNNFDSFQKNYLWFSKPRFFNDPFDCNMELIMHYNNFLNSIQERFSNDISDLIINHTRDFGICCFSETNDNQQLWAHNADSHRGICIEYSEDGFDDYISIEILKSKCVLQNVDYRDNLIDLDGEIEWDGNFTTINDILSLPLDLQRVDRLFEKLLLQKNRTVWGNEREKRMLLIGGARDHIQRGIARNCEELNNGYRIPIKRSMITGIIFGVNTPEDIQVRIRQIFNGSVSYKQAELDFENWKLNIREL